MQILNANTQKEINLAIGNKRSENKLLLATIDSFLKSKRGYVVKMPKSQEPVVACMSGGMDSVANLAILLGEFKLEVYPFFIKRGQSAYKWEKKSVDYFDKFFAKKYPHLYHKTLEIEVATPGKEYKDFLRQTKIAVDKIPERHDISYPARNSVMFLTAMEYAYSLESQGSHIRTVFASHVKSDSSYHCSLTWHRLTNLTMCQITNDWSWQFISLPIEREFGNYYDKQQYLLYSLENGIPIQKTRTCVKDHPIHCGDCPTCWDRRRTYKELKIADPTPYLFKMSEKFPSYYDDESKKQRDRS